MGSHLRGQAAHDGSYHVQLPSPKPAHLQDVVVLRAWHRQWCCCQSTVNEISYFCGHPAPRAGGVSPMQHSRPMLYVRLLGEAHPCMRWHAQDTRLQGEAPPIACQPCAGHACIGLHALQPCRRTAFAALHTWMEWWPRLYSPSSWCAIALSAGTSSSKSHPGEPGNLQACRRAPGSALERRRITIRVAPQRARGPASRQAPGGFCVHGLCVHAQR